MTSEQHLRQLARWIDMDQDAEARERVGAESRRALELRGELLSHLVLRDQELGLAGRQVVDLTLRDARHALPWHRFHSGSPVAIIMESEPGESIMRGVVCGGDERSIRVALQGESETPDANCLLRVEGIPDLVSRDRQRGALRAAAATSHGRLAQLRDRLCGDRPLAEFSVQPIENWLSLLNPSQQAAVQFALSAKDVAIIHGPPGTGKTTTVIELIRQAVARGQRVLACAPSNLATDLLVERLAAAGERVIRVGHPARVTPGALEHTLDQLVSEHPDLKIARRLVREATMLRTDAARFTRAKRTKEDRRALRDEARNLIADARRIEDQLVNYLLDGATVVCATLTGIDRDLFGERRYDLVVIDEAAQATEPVCWIPLQRCDRLVLAGDHCQLPPTILSLEAARQGFATSLMERLLTLHGPTISRQLTIQYRMHAAIMEFPSREFYGNLLVADPRVTEHALHQCAGVESCELTDGALLFIDTAGAGYEESREPGTSSTANAREADLAARVARDLMAAGVSPRDLAVITPYSAQVRLLRGKLDVAGLEIDSIDGFQGREKEAVIISLVRSNEQGEIGFLADFRRINVALTRARRKLIVVGDSGTIGRHPFYQRLLEHFEHHQAYRSVWES